MIRPYTLIDHCPGLKKNKNNILIQVKLFCLLRVSDPKL